MYKAVIAGYSRSPFTIAKKGGLIDKPLGPGGKKKKKKKGKK